MSDLSDGKGTQKVILKINWFAKNAFNIVLILSVMKTYFFQRKLSSVNIFKICVTMMVQNKRHKNI